jgi:hypothetical protein
METVLVNSNDSNDNEIIEDIEPYSEQCDLLQMISIPTFGKYSSDYTFMEQVLIIKKEYMPDYFPQTIKSKIDNLKKNNPDLKPEFFHITLSTSTFLGPSSENEVNGSYTLLNLISHPYVFYNCSLNKEHRSEVYCAAFTDNLEFDTIKEADSGDRLVINPKCNLDDNFLKREIILHLSEDGYPSLSPNNCALNINLNSQIINFYVVVCGTYYGRIVKCFVGNYLIIPKSNNSVLIGDLYNKMVKEKGKNNLSTELIFFKNKFRDYMDYVFNYGIYEITENAKNFEHVKICLNKAFSIIYDFSDNGDEDDDNSKKIHDKELKCMADYYYNNIINFICYLYSKMNLYFAKEFFGISFKKKFIEKLLMKYAKFCKVRIEHIVSNLNYFIFGEDRDEPENADDNYSEEILPNLKSLICDLINVDEDKLEELKDNYNEDTKGVDNPFIEELENLCNDINKGEDINKSVNQLDEVIRKFLFYIVWEYKNKPFGVHDDFGRVSFMNVDIDRKFYCNKNDRIECCEKIIEIFREADEKEFN